MSKAKKSERAVVVTTAHKGVFFGYTDEHDDAKVSNLKRARLCVYWSHDVKGFMGLAASGPTRDCRVGPQVPSFSPLGEITSVTECSPEAAAAWERQPWG